MASVSDDFDRANGEIGANWIEDEGDIDIASNIAVCVDTVMYNRCRYATALDSADHYAQGDMNIGGGWDCAVVARAEDSDPTFYTMWEVWSGEAQLVKLVDDAYTTLDTYAGGGTTYKIEVDGAAQEGFIDTVSRVSDTDSDISAGTYAGICGNQNRGKFDNWSAADLEAPPAAAPTAILDGPLAGPLGGPI